MSFCKNCGQQVADDAAFCANCGTPVQETTQQTNQETAQDFTQQYQTPVQQPSTDEAADAQENKFMAILSYLGILVLIPFFAAKESKFAQYHARQGITLAVFEIAYSIAVAIIKSILSAILPWSLWGLYSAVSTIFSLGSIFFLVLAIMGIVNAAQGVKKELPVIGKIDLIKLVFKK